MAELLNKDLFALISDLIKSGQLDPVWIGLVIITMVGSSVHYLVRPTKKVVENLPTKTEVIDLHVDTRNILDTSESIMLLNKVIVSLDIVCADMANNDKVTEHSHRKIQSDVDDLGRNMYELKGMLMAGQHNHGNRELA